MSTPDLFLWGALPYMVLIFCVTATIWRYVTNPFSWTSKSSEMLEKRMLKWGSLLFHIGIFAVICGHIAGLIIPVEFYRGIGLSDEGYHLIAIAGGLPAGIITFAGGVILLVRRYVATKVRATSSAGDWMALIMLLVVIITGILATSANAMNHTGFDYRTTINPWLRGLMVFQPDPTLMQTVPMNFKVHILLSFVLYCVFPFTRLVHMLSMPFGYLKRSYVLYRRRDGSVYPDPKSKPNKERAM